MCSYADLIIDPFLNNNGFFKLQIAPILKRLKMVSVMMKPTTMSVTMMVGTVVYLMLTQNNVLNAFAIIKRCVQLELLILWLEMDIAKMKPTMLIANMMVVTVVYLISSQNNALNAYAITRRHV